MNRSITRLLVILLVLLVPLAAAAAKDEKVEGYAEWQKGNLIIVDGQRVRPAQKVKYKKIGSLYDIHLGWEVKAKGIRAADGTLVAREIEAKPNGTAMFESEVLQATNEIEQIWVEEGKMFEPGPGGKKQSHRGDLGVRAASRSSSRDHDASRTALHFFRLGSSSCHRDRRVERRRHGQRSHLGLRRLDRCHDR